MSYSEKLRSARKSACSKSIDRRVKLEPDEQFIIHSSSSSADTSQKTLNRMDSACSGLRATTQLLIGVAIVICICVSWTRSSLLDERQENPRGPFDTGLLQDYIPPRRTLGELLQNKNLSFERPQAVQKLESYAGLLVMGNTSTSPSEKGTLQQGISRFVAANSEMDPAAWELEVQFKSAMCKLSKYDENFLQSLNRTEHKGLTSLLRSVGIRPENMEIMFIRNLLHDPFNYGAGNPALQYICSVSTVINQLINQTIIVKDLLHTRNLYLHKISEISNTTQLFEDNLPLEIQSLFRLLWTLAKDNNLPVLKLAETWKEKWEEYYNFLSTALEKCQRGLEDVDAKIKDWILNRYQLAAQAHPLVCFPPDEVQESTSQCRTRSSC
ncbi:hypothetical protein FRC18_000408 [Serendipita sp. 400]|nr:hypothetical protein FRC18_000408 [Serendipita sp. 400]